MTAIETLATPSLLNDVVEISREAGDKIMEIYRRDVLGDTPLEVEIKDDDSPVTAADQAAHTVICERLKALTPELPILSEESALTPFEQRQQWQTYWLVDPLDGTKEFISGNGEFTVNIALIHQHKAHLGVVYTPVLNRTYTGLAQHGAYKFENGSQEVITCRPIKKDHSLKIVASRRHGSAAQESLISALCDAFDTVERVSMGSSLKLCLIAEGVADIYPRFAPTSEWDTAAAQAVVEAAGGRVCEINGEDLRYNAKESILNPYFYVVGDDNVPWQSFIKNE